VAATAVVVVAGIYVVFWPVSDLIARLDAGAITGPHRAADLQAARDAARGRLLTFGAGLFAAGALVYTARNFSLSREGQVTDRYTKAIEQLGSKELDVRLGGIYALERVARDSARDHPTVMEVLAAFVRERSHEQWRPRTNREPGAQTPERGLRPDVQAAVTVIGRRNPRHDRSDRQINLTDANLAHADLIDANLTDAFLIGANLSGAKLIVADLTGALLHDADLTDANLHYTDLTHAFVRGADFAGADLTGVRWPLDEVVPDGWVRDTGSGRLKRTDTNPGGAPTDPAPAA